MSFSDAINKAKASASASASAEKKGDAPRAQTDPAAFQPRKAEEEDEEDEDEDEMELRIPGSFSFEVGGDGVTHGAGGAYGRSVRCGRDAWEFVAAHAAAMKVRARNTFRISVSDNPFDL